MDSSVPLTVEEVAREAGLRLHPTGDGVLPQEPPAESHHLEEEPNEGMLGETVEQNGSGHPAAAPLNRKLGNKRKRPVKPITCLSASEILDQCPKSDPKWIVNELIQEGDQVVLSGPPKSGKTILALQLALAVAKGDHPFLDPKNYRSTEAGIVLFISLEMKPAAIATRLRLQTDPALLKAVGHNLRFLFGLPNQDRVVIAEMKEGRMVETGDALQIQELLKTLRPKLIIIDTLIQIHRFDENQNIVMGELMRHIRRLCSPYLECESVETDPWGEVLTLADANTTKTYRRSPIAHVLVHHNRKGGGFDDGKASPDSIRGAGAIHSEADLAISFGSPGRILTCSVSARHATAPPMLYLQKYGGEKGMNDPLRIALAPDLKLEKALAVCKLKNCLQAKPGISTAELCDYLQREKAVKALAPRMKGNTHKSIKANIVDKLLALCEPSETNPKQLTLLADTGFSELLTAFGVYGSEMQESDFQGRADFNPTSIIGSPPVAPNNKDKLVVVDEEASKEAGDSSVASPSKRLRRVKKPNHLKAKLKNHPPASQEKRRFRKPSHNLQTEVTTDAPKMPTPAEPIP